MDKVDKVDTGGQGGQGARNHHHSKRDMGVHDQVQMCISKNINLYNATISDN